MNKLYLTCGILSVLIVLCALFLMLQPLLFPIIEYEDNIIKVIPKDNSFDTGMQNPDENSDSPTIEPPYECPAELTALIEQNSDVYAWLRIPDTNISYPIVQSPSNDYFYLRRGTDKQYSIAGSIMTEHRYNTTNFDDPVTVIYGHCMESGIMFGTLQSIYSDTDGMTAHQAIEIYLPDKKLEYTVFAAVPYDKRHLLYNYDFNDAKTYTTFFSSIASMRSLSANVMNTYRPEYGDKVIILSTCLWGNSTRRYLVMAKLNA